MNGNRPAEVHYIDAGFAYTVPQSFMDLFEGLSYNIAPPVQDDSALFDEGSQYWGVMHTSSYKYGYSGPVSVPYYSLGGSYEVPRVDEGRRVWEGGAVAEQSVEVPWVAVDVDGEGGDEGSGGGGSNVNDEECSIQTNHNANSPQQVIWQDNIDPDNMTYEELLDLGDAVGTQSRGLSQDKISLLPVTKYKCSFFSRKRSRRERCVICQMDYKRGDRQMTLPCKHVYHSGCVSRWLSINKACPVCFVEIEVSGEGPYQH